MTGTNTKGSKPTHRVYAVTKEGKKNFWREIGAVWPHQDGKGFSLKLDFLPFNSNAELVIREPKPQDDTEGREGGAQ